MVSIMSKVSLSVMFGLLLAVLLFPAGALASGHNDSSSPLCPPDTFYDSSQDCIPLGPAAYLAEMASKGFTFPETPLPAHQPDPALSEIEYQYAYVTSDRAPIYQTLNDAIANRKESAIRWITPGFNYVSIEYGEYARGKYYYYTDVGWMSADDLEVTPVPTFQGLEFTETPDHSFGWVLAMFSEGGNAETKRTPGYSRDDYTGHYLDHLQLVKIYDVERVGKWDWYMVGPDEWIIQTAVAKVVPRNGPPEGFTWDRWIEVNLYEQTVAVYEDRRLVFATLMASGADPYFTYPGVFKIFEKLDFTRMRYLNTPDAYNLENVPWTMYFDESRAFHGAYWRASLGYPQSHGCVNLSVGDSHWLYDWAEVGDYVYVYDPSGKTPQKD